MPRRMRQLSRHRGYIRLARMQQDGDMLWGESWPARVAHAPPQYVGVGQRTAAFYLYYMSGWHGAEIMLLATAGIS